MERFFINQPPFFWDTIYLYPKTRMTWFLKSTNYDLWDAIRNGLHIPIEIENGVVIPKPSQKQDDLNKKKV